MIDINLGCPSPKAARGGVGAAMLAEPTLLREVIAAMRQSVRGPLTAKMRAGVDDASGVIDTATLLQEAGVELLTIHPRRRADGYAGVADWRVIRDVKRALTIPVLGNGDCWCAGDILRMREETGCDGVMVGRGALRNPWIFAQAKALARGEAPKRPSGDDVIAHLHALSRRARKPRAALGHLKEHLRYLRRAVPGGKERLMPALRSQTLEAFLNAVTAVFAPLRAAELDLGVQTQLERAGSVAAPTGPASVSPARLTPPS